MKRTVLPPNARLVPENAKLVFKGMIYDVYHWQQEMFDGTFETFEMLKRPDTVRVIAIKDNQIVMLDQEQPGHGPFFDFPGGRHDFEGETELEAIKRETLEETGMTFKTWKLLDVIQPAGKIDYFIYTFLATDFESQGPQDLGSGEKITVTTISFDELKQLATNPKSRNLPRELLDKAGTLDGLLSLPEYSAK